MGRFRRNGVLIMVCFAIWLDRAQAKIFHFSREKMERKTLEVSQQDHHTHRKDHFDKEKVENKLFKDVAAELSTANQILLLGPGVAKHHFQNFLNEHHPVLSRKIVACETL